MRAISIIGRRTPKPQPGHHKYMLEVEITQLRSTRAGGRNPAGAGAGAGARELKTKITL